MKTKKSVVNKFTADKPVVSKQIENMYLVTLVAVVAIIAIFALMMVFNKPYAQVINSPSSIPYSVIDSPNAPPMNIIGQATNTNYSLTLVIVQGYGRGIGNILTSDGFTCGVNYSTYSQVECTKSYIKGSKVTVTANPAADSLLYYLVISGMGYTNEAELKIKTRTITMDSNKIAYAEFDLINAPQQSHYVLQSHVGNYGKISSSDGYICASSSQCTDKSYTPGTLVTLTATPITGSYCPGVDSTFVGWNGACNGTNPVCVVNMTGPRWKVSLVADFKAVNPKYYTIVNLLKKGTGSGIIYTSRSSNPDICPYCKTYSAVPAENSTFDGWTGCTPVPGTNNCTDDCLKLNSLVSATFTLKPEYIPYTLTLTKGSGTITTTVDGVPTTSTVFKGGTIVTLTAVPPAGYSFTSWSGACTGTVSTCVVNMTANKAVTAAFAVIPKYTLSITKGLGTVTTTDNGVPTTSTSFLKGTLLTLTATPPAGYVFTSWSGACTGTVNTCVVNMTANKAVTATFTVIPKYTLTVTKAGTGTGMVSEVVPSSPTEISQVTTYNNGYRIILKATPAGNSKFTGWSGACTGTDTCTLNMTANKAVTATFTALNCTCVQYQCS